MDQITLILTIPGLPPVRLDFETAPSEVNQTEPHLLALERLPAGGTYRESHGADLVPLTLRGTFGYEARQHQGQAKTGFDLFKELRKLYRDYLTSRNSKDPRIAGGTVLEYHNFTEGEHWEAEASEFRTPRGPENRTHYIYELDLKLVRAIERKFANPVADRRAKILRISKDIANFLRKVQTFVGEVQQFSQDLSTALHRLVLQPAAELSKALESFVSGVVDVVTFPFRAIQGIVDGAQQILEDLGSLPSVALTEGARVLHGLRSSLIQLVATPGALEKDFNSATREFAQELAAWENFSDDVERDAALAGTHAETRALALGQVNASATGVRPVETWANDTLQKIALRELGDASRWHEIALLNGLDRAPYLDANGGEGLAKWGASLLIPTSSPQAGQGVAGALEDSALIQQKATETRLYGRDARLKERDGKLDFIFEADGKLATIAGRDNLLQAVTLKTRIFQGELLENADFGLRRLVGQRMGSNDLELSKWGLEEAARSDPRIKDVSVSLDASGNLAEADFEVTPIDASDARNAGALATR